MSNSAPDPNPGRSFEWRLAMAAAGIVLATAGAALVIWPHLLAYVAGGALALLGLALAVSAFAARSR